MLAIVCSLKNIVSPAADWLLLLALLDQRDIFPSPGYNPEAFARQLLVAPVLQDALTVAHYPAKLAHNRQSSTNISTRSSALIIVCIYSK
jgi:hypothetical protein